MVISVKHQGILHSLQANISCINMMQFMDTQKINEEIHVGMSFCWAK